MRIASLSMLPAAVFAACDLTGNWTSSFSLADSPLGDSPFGCQGGICLPPYARGRLPVHIEIRHDVATGQALVMADPWGLEAAPASVAGATFSVKFVGSSSYTKATISKSTFPDLVTGAPAPDCTLLDSPVHWCKFPYCPVAMPDWPPFPEPLPPIEYNCAIAGSCPPPAWEPTWQLNLSTVAQPCNQSGLFTQGHEFGLVSFDWSNAKALWMQPPRNERTCEELLVEQAKIVKQKNPSTKVFVYRNFELFLQWLSSQRDAMYDPSKADYFCKYQTGPKQGQIYQENIGEGDQFFINWTTPGVVDWFIQQSVLGPGGLASPYVDGVFTDDEWDLFPEHDGAAAAMGLSAADQRSLLLAKQRAYDRMLTALIDRQGYAWSAFVGGQYDGTLAAVTKANCASYVRELCAGDRYDRPVFLGLNSGAVRESIASFLVARGPHWYLGTGWSGCSNNRLARPQEFDLDVGVPLSKCNETTPNVFTREYSKGKVLLDCQAFSATLAFNY